jgi:hypothetical protein
MTATGGASGPTEGSVSRERDKLKQIMKDVEGDLDPRHEKPRPEPSEAERFSWKDLASNATAILAASGVVIYSILTLANGRFYAALGVSPNDVGLGYANTLAGCVGTVLMLVLVLALVACLFFAVTFAILIVPNVVRAGLRTRREINRPALSNALSDESDALDPRARVGTLVVGCVRIGTLTSLRQIRFPFEEVRKTTVKVTVWGVVIVAVLLIAIALPSVASGRARAAGNGRPVSPPRLPGASIAVLPLHADPAEVQAVGDKTKAPALVELSTRPASWSPLLFLGQAGGIAVLYDSELKRSVYVPMAAILLTVSNCAAPTPPASCTTKG